MGQKIDPRGFRLAVTKAWSSVWYSHSKNFASTLLEDIKIRQYIVDKFGRRASIGKVLIERPAKSIKITLFTARPGILIGKKGEGIEQIKAELQKITKVSLHVNVEEIRKPELNAQIVADQVAMQIEKRIAFRRAMKKALQGSIKVGATGVKIMTSGRLNGVDIARNEWYREGRVPLHTLRANVDYATSAAHTTYGIIGVKVWIYKGNINLNKIKFVKSTVDSEIKGVDNVNAPATKQKLSEEVVNNPRNVHKTIANKLSLDKALITETAATKTAATKTAATKTAATKTAATKTATTKTATTKTAATKTAATKTAVTKTATTKTAASKTPASEATASEATASEATPKKKTTTKRKVGTKDVATK